MSLGMQRHAANWWAERVVELDGGADVEVLSRRHGVRKKTLLWWRTELGRRERTSKGRLLPVVISPRSTQVGAAETEATFEVGGARVHLRGATAEYLGAVISAVVRGC